MANAWDCGKAVFESATAAAFLSPTPGAAGVAAAATLKHAPACETVRAKASQIVNNTFDKAMDSVGSSGGASGGGI